LRFLQILIVVLGVLIVGGFAFIGVEVYRRATDPTHPHAWGKEPPPAPVPATLPGSALPTGSKIGEPVSVGYQIAVRVVLPDGTQQLLVIDPTSGKSTVLLNAPEH
jgi:hypothetical protein